jgi:3-oxoacyl-[acyl-carrier protein] reductase
LPSVDFARVKLPGLEGVTVAVTGAASGIGRAAAVLAAQCGARVVAGDISDEMLADLERQAKARDLDVVGSHLDVAAPDSVAEFIGLADAKANLFGVVNSAGIALDSSSLDMEPELWAKVLAVNLTGTFRVSQAAARAMVKRRQGGSIVNIGSAIGTTGSAELPHYAAAKGGVAALTKSLARELGPHQIRVNCVSPGGAINTPMMLSRVSEDYVAARVAGLPMARIGQPEDLAYCIGFLLSGLSSWITGQNLHVNGGSLMQ